MESAAGRENPDVAKIREDYQEMLRKTGQKEEAAAAIRSAFARHSSDQRISVDWRDLRR